jgi:hypothetical protein
MTSNDPGQDVGVEASSGLTGTDEYAALDIMSPGEDSTEHVGRHRRDDAAAIPAALRKLRTSQRDKRGNRADPR